MGVGEYGSGDTEVEAPLPSSPPATWWVRYAAERTHADSLAQALAAALEGEHGPAAEALAAHRAHRTPGLLAPGGHTPDSGDDKVGRDL